MIDYDMIISYDENGEFNPRTVSYESNSKPVNNTSSGGTPKPVESPLVFEETKLVVGDNYMEATGYFKNQSNQTYSYVKVKVDYKDKDGNIVDTDWTYGIDGEGLAPNSRKSFKVMTPSNPAVTNCTFSFMIK
jgi:hypothetical protein